MPRSTITQPRVPAGTRAGGRFATVAAAEGPRDEVTVPVVGFDPALAAAAADAIDQAEAQAAADAALGTVAQSPGEFGAALAGLEFGEGERGDSWSAGPYWAFEHASELFRVVCYTSDGDRVLLLGWDPARPAAKLEAWRAEFAGTTPQSVIIAAIANAVGALPVTR